MKNLSVIIVFIIQMTTTPVLGQKTLIAEASGIYKEGNVVYIVSDNDSKKIYSYSLDNFDRDFPLVLNDVNKVKTFPLPYGILELDLEGIAKLNGDFVVASERTRSLLGMDSLIKSLSEPFTEYGNRG